MPRGGHRRPRLRYFLVRWPEGGGLRVYRTRARDITGLGAMVEFASFREAQEGAMRWNRMEEELR